MLHSSFSKWTGKSIMISNRSTTNLSYWITLLLFVSIVDNATALTWNGAGTGVRWAFNCDFIGNDLKNQLSTGSQCGPLCEKTTNCVAFTWTNYKGGTCWMKSGYLTEFDAVSKMTEAALCGYFPLLLTRVPESSFNNEVPLRWALGCDFIGRGLKNLNSKAETCGPLCETTPGCSHFTWTNQFNGTCWLKTGGASECDAIVRTDSNAVCGFMKY